MSKIKRSTIEERKSDCQQDGHSWIKPPHSSIRRCSWCEVFEHESVQSYVTIYTVLEDSHQEYPFYARISTPEERSLGKKPSEYGYFSDPGEASQEAKVAYGKDIVYVSPEAFEAATTRPL